jgi:hypothetical protein
MPINARRATYAHAIAVGLFALTFTFQVTTRAQGPDARKGREIFRFDTFGDEQLWTTVLRMHEVIPTIDPVTALGVGLKVDVETLPPEVIEAIRAGGPALTNPAVTVDLLKLNAVVGVKGQVDGDGELTSIGITCALCHSTVDDTLTKGVGRRLDGWANRDLNVGAIVGLSPSLDEALKTEFSSWGPGKYDPRHHAFDGMNLIPLNSPSLPIDSVDLRTARRGIRDVYRRWPNLVLERLCGHRADGRKGQLHGSTHRPGDPPVARSRDTEARGPARLPVVTAHARTSARELRSTGSQSRTSAVSQRSWLCDVSPGTDVHRRVERCVTASAAAARRE